MTTENLKHFKHSPILEIAVIKLIEELEQDNVTLDDLFALRDTIGTHYVTYYEAYEDLVSDAIGSNGQPLDVFDYIDYVVESEKEKFGEVYTDLSKPYHLANSVLEQFVDEAIYSNELLKSLNNGDDETKPLTESEKSELQSYFNDLISYWFKRPKPPLI